MKRSDSAWWSAGFTQEWWDGLDTDDRVLFLDSLDDADLESFFKDWRVWGRDTQLAPEGIWTTWLALAGRGWGKTRAGVEYWRDEVEGGRIGRLALVGQGADDIREVMIEGDSGFLKCASAGMRPEFRPAVGAGRLIWPNGAMAYVYSAADPESLRGPQFDGGWFDEPMAVPPENRQKTVSNLNFGLRLGQRPRLIYTTTPKPHRWLRDEIAKAQKYAIDKATGQEIPMALRRYIVTRGNTLENAKNLPESFLESILDDYQDTNLGRQEIYAEILGDEDGALWTADILDRNRIATPSDPGERLKFLQDIAKTCERVVVAVDPNMSASSKTAHAAGVTVIGKRGKERLVLDDRSTKGGPAHWARATVAAYIDFQADEVVAEVNQGGEMVRMVIQQEANSQGVEVKVHKVTATRGKIRRAEPVATKYERNEVKHFGAVGSTDKPGPFYKLEAQMCALHDGFDPTGEDFDRCDSVVWGLTRLGLKKAGTAVGHGAVNVFSFEDFAANAA